MGTRSQQDWSGSIVNGVTLGIPAINETTGEMEWDGGIPNGTLDADAMFHPDGTDENGDPLPPAPVGPISPAWVQPEGAHDAYEVGVIVSHLGGNWENLTAANVFEPGVSGWRQMGSTGEVFPWVQPTGAHDAYQLDDRVTHDSATWTSTVGDNVWEPGVYGWVAD